MGLKDGDGLEGNQGTKICGWGDFLRLLLDTDWIGAWLTLLIVPAVVRGQGRDI